jgi:hypothetical protein
LEEAMNAIANSNATYFEAFANNDSSIFTDRYAENACIMDPLRQSNVEEKVQRSSFEKRMTISG